MRDPSDPCNDQRYKGLDRPHYFYWLNYPVTEEEFSLLWARTEYDPIVRSAIRLKRIAHKLVDATDALVKYAEKRRAEQILGRKLVEREW